MKHITAEFVLQKLLFALSVVFIFTIAGCAKPDQKITLYSDSVILAFGDSLTQGVGTSSENSYPSVLQNMLGLKVFNKGISGEVSSKGLERLDRVLDETNPDLVILLHGGNDILRKRSREELERNLEDMIFQIQSRGAQVLLVGVPQPSISLSSLELYERLAENHNLVAELEILPDLLGDPALKSDRVHLNAEGYAALAKAIATKVAVY